MRGSVLLLLALATACSGDEPEVVNLPPRADAGQDLQLRADREVLLDGRGSVDPEGDPLTFNWTLEHAPADSALADTDPFSVNGTTEAGATTFQPDAIGTYVARLTVSDGETDSAPDVILVEAVAPEARPVADAGMDQSLAVGETASLDGSNSRDPGGDDLFYTWALLASPDNSALTSSDIGASDTANATFTADAGGRYVIGLTVDNGLVSSDLDEMILDVTGDNTPPVADAGPDRSIDRCTAVDLDCSRSSDPDGDPIRHRWSVQRVPEASDLTTNDLSSTEEAETSMYADEEGIYAITCSVFDGQAWSRPSTVEVNAGPRTANDPPSIEVASTIEQDLGTTECVRDDRSGEYLCDPCGPEPIEVTATVTDPDDDRYTIEWSTRSASAIDVLNGGDEETVTLSGPTLNPNRPGSLVTRNRISVFATDCPGATSSSSLFIETSCTAVEVAE